MVSAYLSDLCVPNTAISGRQHLQSAATGTLLVPRAQTATGQRSFAVNGPSAGKLPLAVNFMLLVGLTRGATFVLRNFFQTYESSCGI